MTTVHVPSRRITANRRTVRELLSYRRYCVAHHHQDYQWKSKQVADLVDDLSSRFLENYELGHERSAVASYGHFFLGQIITTQKDGWTEVIDGQQRLTTLILLLIYIRHHLTDTDQQGQLSNMIYSIRLGVRSYLFDVPERWACMDALCTGTGVATVDGSESVANIHARYADMEECFPICLRSEALPHFADWLIDNVVLVEITVPSEAEADATFQSMNDRGL